MNMISVLRDFADGLTRGFALFLTDRQSAAEQALAPRVRQQPGRRR